MKRLLKNVMLGLFIFVFNSIICSAQGGDFPDSPEGTDDPLVDPAPINDFIWILIFSALFLGVYVLLKNKKYSKIKRLS
ncbi:hypothetical protein [Flavobacterium sp.]|uniref:hypothetical protein n=1 Tax=Flavobacterium sp. TaxID=239 RepID=UPI002623B91A|nr:hypothetical protein [Flavobacterium sp.]MDD3003402.1 hypothetical protein [Flavobacterium sp.]